MVANFYITKEFLNSTALSEDEFIFKVNLLNIEVIEINKHKQTNKLFISNECYSELRWNNYSLANVWDADCDLDRDTKSLILSIIMNSSQSTNLSHDEIISTLNECNEENVNGILLFSKNDLVDIEFQIIIPDRRWIDFKRYFLGKFPKTPEFFIEECRIYFDNIFFHERTKYTVGSILDDCSLKIINHLSGLNDLLHKIQRNNIGDNRQVILSKLTTLGHYDESASLEGNAARKDDFTFQFENDKKILENVCCEPHIKLCRTDNYPGDSSYSTNRRIYFHEGKPNIHNGRILVGHIGHHL